MKNYFNYKSRFIDPDRKPNRELDSWIAEFACYESKPDYSLNISPFSSSGGEYSKKGQWFYYRFEKEWYPKGYSVDLNCAFEALDAIANGRCLDGSIHRLESSYWRCDIWVQYDKSVRVATAEAFDNPAYAICLAIQKAILWDEERIRNLHK